jgi:exodeoxyribonuclease VII large subunit
MFKYYSATFQGNTAAQSIITSLSNGLRQWATDFNTQPDLIVIIRGGGAVNDLAYLNDFELAALLAKRTVPIWVGIGHEKDRTILDEVANRSFDTPSKVIGGIRNLIAERTQVS